MSELLLFHLIKSAMVKTSSKTIDNSVKNGIISIGKGVDMYIDKFTPCLENAKSGEIVQTSFSLVSKNELVKLKGWNFNWSDTSLNESKIYKLTVNGDSDIQGLVALKNF